MIALWNTIFYEPLYNALVFLTGIIPGADIGIAVILLTIIVRIILYPLTQKSIVSQAKLRMLEPKINKIKELYPNKEEQTKKILELYKTEKVNPFSGCLNVIFIQLPIIIALYQVFLRGLPFDPEALYSFVHIPEYINIKFLGIIDLAAKSLPLAIIAGITQYIQAKVALPRQASSEVESKKGNFQADLAKSMQFQALYFFPILIAFFGYNVVAAAPLYWITSNLFTIGQEIAVRKKLRNMGPVIEAKAEIVK